MCEAFPICQWTYIGYIHHIKVGRFVRFGETDVNKWFETKATKERKKKRLIFLYKINILVHIHDIKFRGQSCG